MTTPKYIQKIIDDLVKTYDFLYLDSLCLAMIWRKENKLQYPECGFIGNGRESAFYKYVYELINRFYEEHFNKDGYRVGEEFAIWLLKTPFDYRIPIPHHSEINENKTAT
jgi:hypothetical protein